MSSSPHQVMSSHGAQLESLDTAWKMKILQEIRKDTVSRVILVGEAGMGKTWMARQICEFATEESPCYFALWLSLNKILDERSLYESIAYQLSISLEKEGSDEDDSDEDNSEDEKEKIKSDLTTLQVQIKTKLKRKELKLDEKNLKSQLERDQTNFQIQEKLNKKKLKHEGKSYLLLVLDDEGSFTSEENVMTNFYLKNFLASSGPVKILLTRRKLEEDINDKFEPPATDTSSVDTDGETETLSMDESQAHSAQEIKSTASPARDELPYPDTTDILHDTFTDKYLGALLKSLIKDGLLEELDQAWGKVNGFLKDRIVEMSMGLPAAIVVLAKSLNRISQNHPLFLSPTQDKVFKIATLSPFPHVSNFDYVDVEDAIHNSVTSRPNPLLHLAYELLRTDKTVKSSIVDCFWHSLSFFEHCGCVNYQELIAHWILEGYFDPVRSVNKAYKDGHAILMELIHRGILKVQEDNMVMPEVAMKNLIDLRYLGLSGASRIRLAKVFGSNMTEGLGKTNQVDDIIEAVRATRKGEKISTILVSGNRLRLETPENFFDKLKDLEILGLFQPTVDPFVPSLVKLVKLRVLVIRDCDLLKDIEELKTLRELNALEVSGASSLKKISDDFFAAMLDLESLHLSGLQIQSSPSSISLLKKLHCLIIKDCPLLEDLPNIQELEELEVVDISGARGLQTCFDNTPGDRRRRSKNKNFYHLTKLQHLDFSESQIDRLPIFQDSAVASKLHSLTRLLLRNCSKLRKLPSLKPLSGLQILDLSGTTSLVKIMSVCFEDKKELRTLNLTGTNLGDLATTINELTDLKELLLKDCTKLKEIPDIQNLTNLEVIDVSGSTELTKIEGSFEKMFYLREVNLSGTKVMITQDILPMENKISCQKSITLADGRCFKGEKWSQIKDAMKKKIADKPSSSDEVLESQEISEQECGAIQSNEPGSSEFSRKTGISNEGFRQFPVHKALYQKLISFFNSESPPNILEIHGSSTVGDPRDPDKETLANAEFVSFVDSSSAKLTAIFKKIKLLKGCWIRMGNDIEHLLSGVDEERMGSLEILSVTNLPLLDSICTGGSFKNLKRLSIECCPNIKMLFLEASQLPSSLEVLHIKLCEKLVKIFEEECGEVSTLITLRLHELPVLSTVGVKLPNLEIFEMRNCPKLKAEKEDLEGSEKVMVDLIEAPIQD